MKNTRKLWHITLAVVALSLMMTACYSEKKAAKKDVAKKEVVKSRADSLNEQFDLYADSCLNNFVPKMPPMLIEHAWQDLPKNANKADLVNAVVKRAKNVNPKYTIGYGAFLGAIRTGDKAMGLWEAYKEALQEKSATKSR